MRYKILWVIICFTISSPFFAQVSSVDQAISDILGEEADKATPAWSYLSKVETDSIFPFLEAAIEGRLYVSHDGQAITVINEDGYYLYPEFKQINGKIAKEQLKTIKLSRKERVQFNELIPVININSHSATTRATAYQQIIDKREVKWLPLVKEATAKEKDPILITTAQETLYTLELLGGDEKEQSAAIDYFLNNKSTNTLLLFRTYLERADITKTNSNRVKKQVAQWDLAERNNQIYQNVFSGLSLGSILILSSLGLSIIYGLAGIINMSHGEFLMIGAYTTYCMQQIFEKFIPASLSDWSFFLSLPMSFITTALIGLIVERLVIRHLYSRPLESLLATWGISLILIQIARSIFGDLTTVKSPAILSGGWEISEGMILPYNRLFIMGLTIVIFLIVYFVFQKSRLGIKIRSVTQNRNMSACVGISTQKTDMITFMLGSGLAGVAGCAITLIGNVVPDMGQTYVVDSFLVVVTGGVGKLAGCVVSGLGIGVISKAFEAGFEAVYGKVLILFLIIVFLQYRPKGLFADKGRIGDD